jgi:hypothetical protein
MLHPPPFRLGSRVLELSQTFLGTPSHSSPQFADVSPNCCAKNRRRSFASSRCLPTFQSQAQFGSDCLSSLKFAATNGKGIVEHDFLTGRDNDLDGFPSAEDLWGRLRKAEAIDDNTAEKLLTAYYHLSGRSTKATPCGKEKTNR